MRRTSPFHLLASAALGALLLAGTSPASAGTTAQAGGGASAPSVSSSGPLSVLSHDAGSTVVWRPATQVRHGDARIELAIDGEPVSSPFVRLADGAFSVSLPGVTGLAPASLSVVAAGRVLAGAGARSGVTRTAPAAVAQPKKVVKSDPGVKGKHKTTAFTYAASGVRVGGYAAKTEVRARVVLPAKTAKGKRGVVVLLHGRHGTCYSPQGEETIDWPCLPGYKQTPSFRGYEYVQELLASQGYVTVSISANGVNGQDWDSFDGGAEARAELVQHHLDLLAGWNAKGGKGDLAKLKGRLNLKKVVFVGHSRGGEGVNRATIDLSGKMTPVVRGQVLIAPTDFGFQVSPGVPTSVILPYCDGDVYDLQGQAYVDQGRYVANKDFAQKSAIMMLGANHNYFNTEWTPGLSKAPSFDDWWEPADATCGTKAKGRLSAKQQRAAGATYIAAAVSSVLTKDADATRLLDGSAVRAKSAGKAVVLTAGYTGARRELVTATAKTALRATNGMSAESCASGFKELVIACEDLVPESISPHWLVYGDNSVTPWAQAVSVSWKKKGAKLRITPDKVRNLSGAGRLDLRVATAGKLAKQSFDVVLTDTKGRTLTLTPKRQLEALPPFAGIEQRIWAQTVRVDLPKKAKKFNLTKVRSITLKATSAKGQLFFLDAFTSRTAQPKFLRAYTRVPRFEVQDTTAVVGETPSGTQTIEVTIKAKNNVIKSSQLALTVMGDSGEVTQRVVKVPAGQSSLKVPITVTADGVYSPPLTGIVAIHPLRNAVATSYLGTVNVTSSIPVPKLSFPTAHVDITQGEAIKWPYELSALTADIVFPMGMFVEPEAGLSELSSTHVPVSLYSALGIPAPAQPAPLSQTDLFLADMLMPMKSGGVLELPTRGAPKLTEPKHVSFVVFPDEVYLLEPIVLTATINPAP